MSKKPTKEMIERMQASLWHEGVYVGNKTVERALTAALQSAAEAPPPQPNVEQWRPWIDMPVGDQRGVVREVRSENGETALAYWTGEIMALAPVSDNPVPLPFKVWGQRPVQQSNAADLERQAHPPAEHLTPEQSAAITDYRETMASLAWPQTSYQTVTAPVSPAPQPNADVLRPVRTFVMAVRAEAKGKDQNRYAYCDELLTKLDAALGIIRPAGPDTSPVETPSPEPISRGSDDWFSQVVSFLVKHDMLDAREEYDISDVMGALQDNYEPALVKAVKGITDDYQTSENHHPDYVLIPTAKFEEIRTALVGSASRASE